MRLNVGVMADPCVNPSSLPGFPFTTVTVMFVTYCLIQVIKERERRQALLDDPDPVPTPSPAAAIPTPATPTVTPATPTLATPTIAQPIIVSDKQKAE